MDINRYYGQITKVGGYDVKTVTIAGIWTVDYVEVPIGEEVEHRVAIHQEDKRIVKVLPGLVVFED